MNETDTILGATLAGWATLAGALIIAFGWATCSESIPLEQPLEQICAELEALETAQETHDFLGDKRLDHYPPHSVIACLNARAR